MSAMEAGLIGLLAMSPDQKGRPTSSEDPPAKKRRAFATRIPARIKMFMMLLSMPTLDGDEPSILKFSQTCRTAHVELKQTLCVERVPAQAPRTSQVGNRCNRLQAIPEEAKSEGSAESAETLVLGMDLN